MNYKSFNLGDWIGHISGVIEDETTLDGNEMRDLVEFLSTLEQEPCEDAISRKAVLNLARDLEFSKIKGMENYKHRCIEIEDVEELPSVMPDLSSLREINEALTKRVQFLETMNRYATPVTPTQSWIPVSERLPEDRNIVLVTAYWHETYQVMMASYFGEGLWWCVPFNNCGDHMQKLNPKAWQPLPQPYKEKRGDENGSN